MFEQFTAQGRAAARTPCPASFDLQHKPDPTIASLGTFYCSACGAIAPDSEFNDMDPDMIRPVEREERPKEMAKKVLCPVCRGSGYSDNKKKIKCQPCGGTGYLTPV